VAGVAGSHDSTDDEVGALTEDFDGEAPSLCRSDREAACAEVTCGDDADGGAAVVLVVMLVVVLRAFGGEFEHFSSFAKS